MLGSNLKLRKPEATLLLILMATISSTSGCKRKKADLVRLAPAEVDGYALSGKGRTFDRKTIFKELNGGAEVYLDYGFISLYAANYKSGSGPEITLHIFDMGSAADAYGIFTHEREGTNVDIGQDSEYEGGLLRFWKGKYFVSVLTRRESPAAKKAAFELARNVAQRIKRTGRRPELIRALPEAGLHRVSVRYLHTYPTLVHHLSVGNTNLLGLSKSTDVVVAEYRKGKAKRVALVVRYRNTGGATRGLGSLESLDRLAARKQGANRVNGRTCGRIMAAVFGPGPPPTRTTLLENLTKRLPECSDARKKNRR